MGELNARLHVEGMTDEESSALKIPLDGSWLARMEVSTWTTDAGDLDILTDMPDRTGRHLSYDELVGRTRFVRHQDLTIRVAALDDIIASKEWADRPKDHDALPELRALRDEQNGGTSRQ